jgi:hypothetical protein
MFTFKLFYIVHYQLDKWKEFKLTQKIDALTRLRKIAQVLQEEHAALHELDGLDSEVRAIRQTIAQHDEEIRTKLIPIIEEIHGFCWQLIKLRAIPQFPLPIFKFYSEENSSSEFELGHSCGVKGIAEHSKGGGCLIIFLPLGKVSLPLLVLCLDTILPRIIRATEQYLLETSEKKVQQIYKHLTQLTAFLSTSKL